MLKVSSDTNYRNYIDRQGGREGGRVVLWKDWKIFIVEEC